MDFYCCQKEKLSENWLFIDIPYWLKQQSLDIFKGTQEVLNSRL
ncbi:hypothetical protein [Maledivibacter halophilus]|nr:hypothetical protein [Maledivibacter halophilus]